MDQFSCDGILKAEEETWKRSTREVSQEKFDTG